MDVFTRPCKAAPRPAQIQKKKGFIEELAGEVFLEKVL